VNAGDIARLFDEAQYEQIALNIDTGTDDAETSRALIVFNPTSLAVSGIAVFHVDMPWPAGRVLPSIGVTHLDQTVQSSLSIPTFLPARIAAAVGPPAVGTKELGRLIFDLRFEVHDVPANGWDTYIAKYGPDSPADKDSIPHPVQPISALAVVETTRHHGVLDPRWTLK
jgi:hypothetical protein